MRKTLTITALSLAVLVAAYGVAVWRNNSSAAPPDAARLEQSLAESIGWLAERQDKLVARDNAMLWWMLREASVLTPDERLVALVRRYRERWIDPDPLVIWRPLFEPDVYVGQPVLEEYPDAEPYQMFFVYGLSCDTELGRQPLIRRQLDPNWCGWSPLNPRCVTHQFVGVRFMQRTGCGDTQQVGALAAQLQDRMHAEMTWDPRVADAYLQRAVLLLESGEAERVKPVWLARILAAQNDDGGWDDLDPLLSLPGGKALGWSTSAPALRSEKSTFHATAQGVWLVSLLLAQQ